jgi:hypothetical protein
VTQAGSTSTKPQTMRRARLLVDHIAPAPAAAAAEVDVARTGAPTATRPPKLLNDNALRQFITEGFLILPLSEDLSPEFHATVHEQVENLAGQAAIGNNIFPAIPALGDVLASPTVNGALCSVLGHDYALHAHRALHRADRPEEQGFHKDGQEGHGPHRHHRPRWAMIMYVRLPKQITLQLLARARPLSTESSLELSDNRGTSIVAPQVLPGRVHSRDGAHGNPPGRAVLHGGRRQDGPRR